LGKKPRAVWAPIHPKGPSTEPHGPQKVEGLGARIRKLGRKTANPAKKIFWIIRVDGFCLLIGLHSKTRQNGDSELNVRRFFKPANE